MVARAKALSRREPQLKWPVVEEMVAAAAAAAAANKVNKDRDADVDDLDFPQFPFFASGLTDGKNWPINCRTWVENDA